MWKTLFSWRKEIPNGEREEMEADLDDVFQPIMPRPQFVDGLRRTLKNYSMVEDMDNRMVNQQEIIVLFAGFLSAALLLSIGIRAIITLIGAVGVIQYHRRQVAQNQATTAIKTTIL